MAVPTVMHFPDFPSFFEISYALLIVPCESPPLFIRAETGAH